VETKRPCAGPFFIPTKDLRVVECTERRIGGRLLSSDSSGTYHLYKDAHMGKRIEKGLT
jgi:hypothetical protein